MKDTKCIPYGDYCYVIKRNKLNKDGTFTLKVEYCPYYIHDEHGYCEFLNLDGKDSALLWDGVKECNENMGDDGYYEQKN